MHIHYFTLCSWLLSIQFLILVSITLSTQFSSTAVNAAPVPLVPRRTPIISTVLGGILKGGHSNGGVSVGAGEGGSLLHLRKPLPLIPRHDQKESHERETRVKDDPNSSNYEGVQPSHILPKSTNIERSHIAKRGHKLESRGTGIGGFYSKEMPNGR